mmetsp:Transcript_53607/g.129109  ORF Transcript_53607/g.129109 Transcript_53607/m.129109 type:complete len:303 (+) Transcript_53607:771-1679(+)
MWRVAGGAQMCEAELMVTAVLLCALQQRPGQRHAAIGVIEEGERGHVVPLQVAVVSMVDSTVSDHAPAEIDLQRLGYCSWHVGVVLLHHVAAIQRRAEAEGRLLSQHLGLAEDSLHHERHNVAGLLHLLAVQLCLGLLARGRVLGLRLRLVASRCQVCEAEGVAHPEALALGAHVVRKIRAREKHAARPVQVEGQVPQPVPAPAVQRLVNARPGCLALAVVHAEGHMSHGVARARGDRVVFLYQVAAGAAHVEVPDREVLHVAQAAIAVVERALVAGSCALHAALKARTGVIQHDGWRAHHC